MQRRRILPEKLTKILRKHKYQLVGRHSAVKKCRWLHKSLLNNGTCYKQKFYGIKSWRCLQMTPSVAHCTLHCIFCWRIQSSDLSLDFLEQSMLDWDDPLTIINESIRAQTRILSGYKDHLKVNKKRYLEALEPKHAAISLAGEPTLYTPLSDLLQGFHKRGFTTFIVTNGTVPETLEKLDEEPSQIYVSLTAPDKSTFRAICRPQVSGAWEHMKKTLDFLPSFKCPTVIRLTLIRHMNLKHSEKYAKLIEKANPTYVEPKAYMFVGMSRLRLGYDNMPTHMEIKEFGGELSDLTNYKMIDEAAASRVVLLSRLERPIKLA